MAALFKRKRDPTRNESSNKTNFTLVNNQSQSVLVAPQSQTATTSYLTQSIIGGNMR